jgi:hypothetical protein
VLSVHYGLVIALCIALGRSFQTGGMEDTLEGAQTRFKTAIEARAAGLQNLLNKKILGHLEKVMPRFGSGNRGITNSRALLHSELEHCNSLKLTISARRWPRRVMKR